MGRYDKIKVYNGSSFVKPKRIQVYTGTGWADLGLDDSDNTNSLNVYNGSKMVRATLNKTIVKVAQGSYAAGSFKFLPDNGFCICPNSRVARNGQFVFEGTIYKESDGDKRLFYSGNSSGSNKIEIWWLNNGKIQVKTATSFGGTTNTITSTNSVGTGQWVPISVYQNVGSYTLYISFNGVVSTGNQYNNFSISNVSNTVGSSGIRFKDNLRIKGIQYKSSGNLSIDKTNNMSIVSGSDGVNYANVTHYDETKEEIKWE